MKVSIKFFASAKQAAGVDNKSFNVNSAEELVTEIRILGGEKLIRIIESSPVLNNGKRVNIFKDFELKDNLYLEVLPPFAGG